MYIDMCVPIKNASNFMYIQYYSEVANSGSSAIPGHSYNFHVKLFKMEQTKLYTLITVYGPFCI